MSVKCILTEQEKTLSELQISKFYNNKNLTINWDFRKPVNKNGENIYTISNFEQITIDMWEAEHNGILQIMDGYIFISCTSTDNDGYINFYQRLNQNYLPLNGKTITISAILSGNCSITHGYKPPEYDYRWSQGIAYNSNSIGLYTETYTLPADASDIIPLLFQMKEGEEVNIYAVKVEIGDTQTLAHQDSEGNWIINEPIDYNLQYALCSQYSPNTGEFIENQYSNTNLADNWYFINPINQRGALEYINARGYFIDRWISNLVEGTNRIIKLQNCLDIKSNHTQNIFTLDISQLIDKDSVSIMIGKTITASVLFELNELQGDEGRSFFLQVANDTKQSYQLGTSTQKVTNNITLMNFVAQVPNNWEVGDVIRFTVGAYGTSIKCKLYSVKLELGSIQTLARKEGDIWVLNDPPPNRALELMKCQRYYWKSDMTFSATEVISPERIICNVQFPVQMRVTPNIQILSQANTPNVLSEWATMQDSEVKVSEVLLNNPSGFSTLVVQNANTSFNYAFHVIADANF